MGGNRAWLYCWVKNDGKALNSQKRQLERHAAEWGFEVVGHSGDVENASDLGRPGLRKLHMAMEKGCVDALLLESLSCLGRDLNEILQNWEKLRKNSVRLWTIAEGEVYLDIPTLFLDLFGKNDGKRKHPPG